MGVHPSQQCGVRHEAPSFVVHDPALAAGGVQKGGLHPCRRAGHEDRDEGRILGDARQVERDHREGRVERHRRRPVEEPCEVTGDEPTERVPDKSAVFGEASVRIIGAIRCEQPVDDRREDGYVGAPDRAVDRDVDRGVLQRAEAPVEHGLGQGADQVPAARGDGPRPAG